MKTLLIRARAKTDLRQIRRHIARDRPMAAARLVKDILDGCADLCERPTAGRPLDEVGDDRVLFYRVGLHYIAYRTTPDAISVERVIHGAREVARVYRFGE